MSKVKDILGIVVRSITKRILGTNVPPMPNADGTLLYHLKRIKDGVKAAYDALEERRIKISEIPRNIDNLKDALLNASFPSYASAGDRSLTCFGDAMFVVDNNATEIIDYETDINLLPNTFFGSKTQSKTAFPNATKLTMLKETAVTNISGDSYMIPNHFKDVELHITSCARYDWKVIVQSANIERLSLPKYEYGGGVYGSIAKNCAKLKTIELPLYNPAHTNNGNKQFEAISNCASLEEIHIPLVGEIGCYSGKNFDGCTSLKTIIAATCNSAFGGNAYVVFGNIPAIEKIVLGGVFKTNKATTKFASVNLDNLSHLEFGEGTSGLMPTFEMWTAANVADDLLNSNFKTYFAERLATFTDGSVHTLTFCQSFYDRLTEENKTILANKGWTIAISE